MADELIVSVSGVRGIAGGSLTPEVARRFGCAFGTMLGGGATVAIGRDTRKSGPALREAVTAGLLDTGANVVDLAVASTPAIALTTRQIGADGGVVITASHNPAEYNGIKFLQPTGTGLTAADADRLKAIWQSGPFALAGGGERGSESQLATAHTTHVAAVLDVCDVGAISARGFKVAVDSNSGAGCESAAMLLGRLGCNVIHLNSRPDGNFSHPPEPVEANLGELCEAVRAQGAAVGFAQDADADRLAIVDEKGDFPGEEYTLALAAAFVLRKRKGKVATNLVTSRMIDDVAEEAGCEVIRTPTGEANVVEALCANDCIFGGEGGGGVIEPRVVPVRDSLVGMAYVLQYMAETHQALSELVARIPRYVMIKTKIPCGPDAAVKVSAAARKAFETRGGAVFNEADGLRIDLGDGWVCARASNTEPILRIIGESPSSRVAESLVDEVRGIAESVSPEN